jgi:hypothetical protein
VTAAWPELDEEARTAVAVERYTQTAEFRDWRDAYLAEKLIATINRAFGISARATRAVLAAALENLGAGEPEFEWQANRLRDSARWWAENTSPPELEAYLVAALRQVEGKAIAGPGRKRIFAALWDAMPAQDKAAFLKAIGAGK